MSYLTRLKRIVLCIGWLLATMARPGASGVGSSTQAQSKLASSICDCVTTIPASECMALVTLYETTGGGAWRTRNGWLTDCDPNTWYGVTIDKGHVVGLALADNNLIGTLPDALGNLNHLLDLNLRGNRLSGAVPPSLGQLTALCDLDLALNALKGDLPTGLMNLRALRQLDLGYNGLQASDEPLRVLLDNLDPDWRQTQTVAPEGVRAVALSGTSALVFWTPPPFAESPGCYAIRTATLRQGPYVLRGFTQTKTESSVVISNLDAAHMHYFCVYAYTPAHDQQQNAMWSDGSWPIHDQDDVVWAQEAEEGHLTYPMQVWQDEGALDGSYIASPDNSAGQVTLAIELAERGFYTFWARSMGLDFDQNSFYLSLDGAPETHYELPALDGRWDWRWRKVYRAAESDAPMALLAGTHYITFRAREIGTRLDRVMVVQHPMQDPLPATPWPTLPAPTVWPTATAKPTATPDPTGTRAPKADIWLPLLLR